VMWRAGDHDTSGARHDLPRENVLFLFYSSHRLRGSKKMGTHTLFQSGEPRRQRWKSVCVPIF
jgi:hypothetical protein